MLLWIIFAGLTTIALVAVLWPYLFPRKAEMASADEGAFDAAVYRDQLEELEADAARGLISAAEAEAARVEISRRLLAAADQGQAKSRSGKGASSRARARKASTVPTGRLRPAVAVLAAALVLPLLSLSLYLTYGSPALPDQPLAQRLAAAQQEQKIDVLIRKVEERLQKHPEDGEGWDVIAPVYLRLKRYNDAAHAYNQAIRLLGENESRLVGLGEALVLANNGIVTEPARRAFARARARGGFIPKAQFWLGIAAEQDGDYAAAAKLWREMLARGQPDAPWRTLVQERLQLARKQLGESVDAPEPSAREMVREERGPTQEDVAAARQMTAKDRAAMINRMVEGLAERLKQDGSDLQGWLRLVRAYTVLGKREKAGEALDSARGNFVGDEQALAALEKLKEELGL